MVAHLLPKQRVAGSNPVSRSTTRAAHQQTPPHRTVGFVC